MDLFFIAPPSRKSETSCSGSKIALRDLGHRFHQPGSRRSWARTGSPGRPTHGCPRVPRAVLLPAPVTVPALGVGAPVDDSRCIGFGCPKRAVYAWPSRSPFPIVVVLAVGNVCGYADSFNEATKALKSLVGATTK